MTNHFTSDFFKNNRQQLRNKYDQKGLIIITANGLLQRNADTTYPFSQEANFWYLTGINEPDLLLVIDDKDEYIIAPERSVSRQAFDGSISDEEITGISGIKKVYSENQGWEFITGKIKQNKAVGVLGAPPAYMKAHGIYTNPSRSRLCKRLQKIEPEIKLNQVNEILRDLRIIKQTSEIAAIQKAIDITIETLNENLTPNLSNSYKYEYEIEANITKGFRAKGASGHAYEPIVAAGERACTLHYIQNNGKLKKNELVVVDVGAEVEHYAADITRTVTTGRPTVRQKEIYKKVLEVHEYASGLLKPGVFMRDYEKAVREFLGEKLVELGLIDENTPEATIKYYPHSTSHFLGLNVHDVGDYDAPLEAGMVLTVEPGIYISQEGIGIRLEDDILITKKGIKNLSEKLPKTL